MFTGSTRPTARKANRMRRLASIALCAAVPALLAALPSAQASASSTARAATITGVPPAEVEKLLGETPLGALPVAELAHVLSGLPGLTSLEPSKLEEAFTEAIEHVAGEGADLEELLEPGTLVPTLEAKLIELIPALATLLGGNPSQKLTEALESATSSQVVSEILGSSANPEELIAQILGALDPEKLEALLGSVLAGEPFSKTTLGELAALLGKSPEEVDEGFKTSTEQVPATAMALTAPMTDGETLGVLPGLDGIHLGLVEGDGTLGTGGSGGAGANGGSGGSGAGPGGGTTIVIDENQSGPAPGAAASAASASVGKVKVLSHRVKGKVAKIVIQVPAAGKLAMKGKGVRSVSREADRAERVTLGAALSKAGAASVRRHRRLKVKLSISFKPVTGPGSSAAVNVAFR
jgi:hypothetical protein